MQGMMRRTGFARKEYVRPPASPLRRVERPVTSWLLSEEVRSIPKANPLECEQYRRLVAARPCSRCRVEGYSQCAHGPTLGKGIKADDRGTFALCCTRPGIPGCHYLFDQYMLGDDQWRRDMAAEWSARTRAEIVAEGNWPVSLPLWDGA
jgi:hypothetical protein